MESAGLKEVRVVYEQLLEAWNNGSARGMADLFTSGGEIIGYDGSQAIGQDEIFSHLKPIFQDHAIAQFVGKVKNVSLLSSNTVLLRAIAGMIPPGQTEINPKINTHHTLVAVNEKGNWHIILFQNTPAQFHGRPELVEQMTEELSQLLY